jgi:2-amino-4-hydroxy-6-hydroxymethyldihydropteridine diphosphokinase
MSFAWRTATVGREPAVRVFLGLGSNLGDRGENLRRAVAGIGRAAAVEAVSSVYESAPWGFADQPDFWNLVVQARTSLPPAALLSKLKALETELGRTPTFRMGPRVIDIDILLYGEERVAVPGLAIPHPGLRERPFVLRPLLDLDETLLHPETGEPLAERWHELAGTMRLRALGALSQHAD